MKTVCWASKRMKRLTTRNVFLVMGYIVVCFPAMLWDSLHYRKSKECWFKGKSSLFMLLLNCQKKEKSDSKIKTDASQVMKMCLCKRQMVKQEKQLHIMFGPLTWLLPVPSHNTTLRKVLSFLCSSLRYPQSFHPVEYNGVFDPTSLYVKYLRN